MCLDYNSYETNISKAMKDKYHCEIRTIEGKLNCIIFDFKNDFHIQIDRHAIYEMYDAKVSIESATLFIATAIDEEMDNMIL